MKARYKAEKIRTTKNHLVVYVRVDVGHSVRWANIMVPWAMLTDHHREMVEAMERIYVAQLEADADVQYLPLEKWE